MTLTPTERVEAEDAEREQEWLGESRPVCPYCHRPVDPGVDFQRVIGWINPRGKEGFRRDHYEQEWAHKVCLDIEKSVGHGQLGLIA